MRRMRRVSISSELLICGGGVLFDSVCELIEETIRTIYGRGCYFVVECYGSVGCVWRCSIGYTVYGFSKNVCVLCLGSKCAFRCSFRRFCLCVCMSEVISSFRSLRAGSQVFALIMLFRCVILHTMWSGKNRQLLCILPFGILCLSAIRMMLVKIILAV